MVEITSEKQNKVKRMKRTEDSLSDPWVNIKHINIQIIGVPEGEEKKQVYEKVFEEIIVEIFPNMEKEIVSQVQLSHPYMTTGKTIALTRWTFVDKVMSLLFNMLSRLVIAFLPRSKHLLISWLQLPSPLILEPLKIKSATISTFPIYFP